MFQLSWNIQTSVSQNIICRSKIKTENTATHWNAFHKHIEEIRPKQHFGLNFFPLETISSTPVITVAPGLCYCKKQQYLL